MVSFDHRDPGTPEAEWEAAGLRDRATPWTLDDDVRHVVVLAAHPDDETLGAGGLLARAAGTGVPTAVVVASDGEGSHPTSGTSTAREIALARRLELVEATGIVAPGATLHLLGLPDGGLREHRAALAQHVDAVLDALDGPVLVAAPWRGDGHRDHRVLGEVAAAAVALRVDARLVEYPVWAWHWADPHGDDLPWDRLLALRLGVEEADLKRRALAAHRTQVEPLSDRPGDEPVLHAGMLEHFARDVELFVADDAPDVTPGPAASLPQEFFDRFYARRADPWGFETRWYEERKRDLTLAVLPRARFGRGLEVGCSTGVLTARLAERCDSLLGVDITDAPLAAARARLGERVRLEKHATPADWPEGRFDLVVLSEVGYYWDAHDLARGVDRAVASLADDGVLVACHWRHPVREYPTTGDAVHRALRAHDRLALLARHVEEDFLLDVLVPAPAVSVARAEGLL
ncbi:LmbE family N-acetylglucosaminyl deacetylase [Sediminihabitans luteus]|uniref:LmbE family N-acetylglucosaminyl deacetylase n=1 Tax=Sediminihabitans luteus TaxID=1138585 RepID=A0A2M9CBZ2_9CELL|nr:bifunctional PIG-L family deacetylase/class I SAM-dependent methyltransferase [Sediminihabitans luteus]PJJ68612.1 LmbE family N-acetylglucosaminyl deacetylase [Sediminihabitans luteus]GII99950.1 hypothetical protein Slu03_23280 [Sediminihabitans luteus]